MSTNGKLPTKPLQGRRILVTRAAEQAAGFSEQLRLRGAVVIECPTIQLGPPATWAGLDAALQRLPDFDWLILTSVNGVRFFFARLLERGLDQTALQTLKVCAVGPKTAEALHEKGVVPSLVPALFTAEGVVAAFQQIDLQGSQILFPKADGARDLITQQLRSKGAVVVDPVAYRNAIPASLPDAARLALEQRQVDAVVFSAPSTVRNLITLAGGTQLLQGLLIASIGPVTSTACRERGLLVGVEPEQATLDALLDALEQFFRTNN